MWLQIAAAQFARSDRRPVTYVVLDRRGGAWSGANRKERIVEQQQTKDETQRPPRKADSAISRRIGDIAHSIHIIIDAAGSDFASSVSLLVNKHPGNERVAAEAGTA